jgi:RNA polymerase sigma factor for flagellar operon FliA
MPKATAKVIPFSKKDTKVKTTKKAKSGKKEPFSRERAWQDYQGLVKWVSASIAAKCRNFVTTEDLISVGTIGLLKAMDRFNPKKKAQFRTYAVIKIRGEILDYIRKNYPRPVSQQIKARDYAAAAEELRVKHQRKPTIEEIAAKLEVTVEEAHEMADMAKQVQFVEWDQIADRGQSGLSSEVSELSQQPNNILANISRNELQEQLQKILDGMPPKVRDVLKYLYYEEKSQIEVAGLLNLSPSRVSQLHSEGIVILQESLNRGMVKDCLRAA